MEISQLNIKTKTAWWTPPRCINMYLQWHRQKVHIDNVIFFHRVHCEFNKMSQMYFITSLQVRGRSCTLVLHFIVIRPALNTQYHAASVEVSVFSRQLIQCSQRPLQGLQGPRCCYRVLVPVRVLLIVAVQGQVAPEHVDSNAELKSQRVVEPKSWKLWTQFFHFLIYCYFINLEIKGVQEPTIVPNYKNQQTLNRML